MKLSDRIAVLERLGKHLRGKDEYLEAVMARSLFHNGWFTIENQEAAIQAIANEFLDRDKLKSWTGFYELSETASRKTVGLVLAGNLPLVGFHDVLAVFIAGHRSQIKLSEKDKYLLPYLVELLERFDERSRGYFEFVEQLNGFDAIIATGSNNSARYFEAYFGKYPNIIRSNRNGVAVLTGEESASELRGLGEDIFMFFGLGCRNVSKVFIPKDYDLDLLLEALYEFKSVVLNSKYKNNFDHNYAILILNKEPFKANGCILLKENDAFHSPIGCLYYSYYESVDSLQHILSSRANDIQCVVSHLEIGDIPVIPLGKAQKPGLMDYADGIDTMQFLVGL
jgi:hypothetical protein